MLATSERVLGFGDKIQIFTLGPIRRANWEVLVQLCPNSMWKSDIRYVLVTADGDNELVFG